MGSRVGRSARRYGLQLLHHPRKACACDARRCGKWRPAGATLVVVIGWAALGTPAAAQRVVDGDTLDLNGTRWGLRGIDAPETQADRGSGSCLRVPRP